MIESFSFGKSPRLHTELGVCNPVYVPNMPSDAVFEGYCEDIRQMGIRWIRTDMIWGHVQAGGPTSFNWTKYDKYVEIAHNKGLKLLFILAYSVGWANGGQGQMVPPTNASDYANYCAAAVARYSPLGVKHWEIWNEPNLPGFWNGAPNATEYGVLLSAAYDAIKAVDSFCTVLLAGMASTGDTGSNIAPETFMQTLYNNGLKDKFDIANYHPYGWNLASMNRIFNTMSSNGDSAKKMWFTEYGNPTNGTAGQNFYSESLQSQLIIRACENICHSYLMDKVERMFIYAYKDYAPSQPDREGYFGVKRSDDTPKPVYYAIRDMLT